MREGAARIASEPSHVNIKIRFGRFALKGEKYSTDADSVYIHIFFAQVKAETDQNKKAKQLNFLKPLSDYLWWIYWSWISCYVKWSENQIQMQRQFYTDIFLPCLVSRRGSSSWWSWSGNSHSDPPQHYSRTVSVLYITPHKSLPKVTPSRQIIP